MSPPLCRCFKHTNATMRIIKVFTRRTLCMCRVQHASRKPCRRHVNAHAQMKCLIFDCDGVILESEDLHRRAYNASFEQFEVKNDGQLVQWSSEFYDELQNKGACHLPVHVCSKQSAAVPLATH